MRLLIDPAALAELNDAAGFYRGHTNAALGGAFVDEFERVTKLLLANPRLGSVSRNGVRQHAFHSFPYLLLYQIAGNELRIIAVSHQRRKPGYWVKRIWLRTLLPG